MNSDGTFKGKVSFYSDAAGTTARGGAGFLTINGHGYTVINALGTSNSDANTGTLTSINNSIEYYALGADIDATATAGNNATWRYIYYNSYYGDGFRPIGSSNGQAFTGTFDGLGHTINNLYISHPNYNTNYTQATDYLVVQIMQI